MADWAQIRNEYINGGVSYRKLAEKHGVKFSRLKDIAVRERWAEAREQRANSIRTETERLAVEKTAEAESEIAAIKSRINLRLMQMIEASLPTIEAGDTDRLRKVVQSYKDMCELKGNQDAGGDTGTGVVMMPEVIPLE